MRATRYNPSSDVESLQRGGCLNLMKMHGKLQDIRKSYKDFRCAIESGRRTRTSIGTLLYRTLVSQFFS